MNVEWLLRLYPRAWRALYEDEFRAVLDRQPPSLRSTIDVARGALDAHLHPSLRTGVSRRERRRRRREQTALLSTPPRPRRWCLAGALAALIAGGGTYLLQQSSAVPVAAPAPIDGIPCQPPTRAASRTYCRLMLIDHGRPIALPAGIGLSYGPAIFGRRCSYGLWTGAASGVVHMDGPSTRVYTLGQFCDIWRRTARVDASFVNRLRATPANAIHVYVGGKGVGADYRDVILTDREQVTIEIDAPPGLSASRVDSASGNDL